MRGRGVCGHGGGGLLINTGAGGTNSTIARHETGSIRGAGGLRNGEKAGCDTAAPKAASKPAIPDNIELLKGVGPKLVAQLKSLGITSLDQIANWTSADIADIDPKLGVFTGRIGRDNWVDQAKLLVAGDVAGFEKKYGALGSEITKG